MRKFVLAIVAAALIATSASQAVAARQNSHVCKDTVGSAQVCSAGNFVELPGWRYPSWSAPAGR